MQVQMDGQIGAYEPRPVASEGEVSAKRLQSIVDRVERLEEEKKALASDIKDIFLEAKSAGFDVPVLKEILRARKQAPSEVEEQRSLFDVYANALGM